MQERYPFWYGGASGIAAACCTHPLDLAKARMQTASGPSNGMIRTIAGIIYNEGPLAIYDGLSASILRQATYTTARFGAYEKIKEYLAPHYNSAIPAYVLLPVSMFSGLVGSLVGNPSDVVNVRMQNDRTLKPELRRNYAHALDGIYRLIKEEGLPSLFRGFGPNAIRGILMTASQVVSYDESKRFLVESLAMDPTSRSTFFTASIMAGFVATTVCSPADVVKTLVMNASKDQDPLGNIKKAYKTDGIRFFFRGWTPAFMRLGPQTVVTFVVLEQLKSWRVGMPPVLTSPSEEQVKLGPAH